MNNKWILDYMRNGGLMAEAIDADMLGEGGGAEEEVEVPQHEIFLVDEEDEIEDDFAPVETVVEEEEPEIETVVETVEEAAPVVETEVVEEVAPVVEPEVTPEVEPIVEEVVKPEAVDDAAEKKAYLDSVEKDFAISEEDANLILSEPENILPRMAANIYARVMDDAQAMIRKHMESVPQMLEQVNQQKEKANALHTQFHSLNPGLEGLDKKELNELITAYVPLVNKQKPKGTMEEKMQILGKTIAALKGITLGGQAAPVAPAVIEPVRPHTPVATARSGLEKGKPAPANGNDAFIDALLLDEDN